MPGGVGTGRGRCLGLAGIGETNGADEEAAALLAIPRDISSRYTVDPLNTEMILAALDWGVGDREQIADSVFDEQWHWSLLRSVDRWRGKAYLLRGELDVAERWLDAAVASCREREAQLELGRCFQDQAALVEGRGDHDASLVRLDEAGDIYSRLGAGGYLNQMIARKEILKAYAVAVLGFEPADEIEPIEIS